MPSGIYLRTEYHKNAISIGHLGNPIIGCNRHNWSGDNPKYWAVHKYINRHYGQPNTCEDCKISGLTKWSIHWANKSGKYLRDRNDWLRLCRKCHSKFDIENDRWGVTKDLIK